MVPYDMLAKQIMLLLTQDTTAMQALYARSLEPYMLSAAELDILATLKREEALAIKDLANTLSLGSSTLSSLVKRLEERQFVKRLENPKDQRSVLIALTDKGNETVSSATRIPRQMTQTLEKQGMQEKELYTLLRLLATLQTTLENQL